ncbi:MAG: hypothetical protein WCP28_00610 [Actinomycetes bacterium]
MSSRRSNLRAVQRDGTSTSGNDGQHSVGGSVDSVPEQSWSRPGSVTTPLADLTLQEIRERRQRLMALEGRVSYWRRIIQARLDLLRDGSLKRGTTVEGLQRVLSQQLGSNNRLALMNVQPGVGMPPIDGLGHLWNRGIDPTGEERAALEADLKAAEQQLSTRRRELFDLIDAYTAELVSRYRECPSLALTALPTRPENPVPL